MYFKLNNGIFINSYLAMLYLSEKVENKYHKYVFFIFPTFLCFFSGWLGLFVYGSLLCCFVFVDFCFRIGFGTSDIYDCTLTSNTLNNITSC